MKDECLICGAPLKYLENDELMECAICHKKENDAYDRKSRKTI